MQKSEKRFWVIFISFFLVVPAFAQQSLIVKVVENAGEPIPYCTVAWSQLASLVTDEKGAVTIPDKSAIRDSIVISTVGHKSRSVKKSEIENLLLIEVTLEKNVVVLPDVRVSTIKNFIDVGYYEKKGGRSFFTSRLPYAMELAQLINGYGYSTFIHEVGIFIEKESEEHLPFRVRFYKNENNKPGAELSSAEIIVSKYKSNSWYTMNVDTFDIEVPADGFFISIQWLTNSATDKRRLNIGMTNKFDVQPCYSNLGNSGWVLINGDKVKYPYNLLVNAKLLSK